MKKLIVLTLFLCHPLLCMDADAQPDIGEAISLMKQQEATLSVLSVLSVDHAKLQDHVLVLLANKKEYTIDISSIAFLRRKDGEYNRTQLPNDFSTKILCGDSADEIEVIDSSDGNKHHFLYDYAHKGMAHQKVGGHLFLILFQNHPALFISGINDQLFLNTFFSSPQTTQVPVQKFYPHSREIAQYGTKHESIFRMPDTNYFILTIFSAKNLGDSIVLPTKIVAVTPEGCFTLPFPVEKIKNILQEKDTINCPKEDLSHSLLEFLVKANNFSGTGIATLHTYTSQKVAPAWLQKPFKGCTINALIEETQADTLSLTKISFATLRRYKASLEETL